MARRGGRTPAKPFQQLENTIYLHSTAIYCNHRRRWPPPLRPAVNGVPASSRNHRQAFVQQADLFFSMLTVSETLDMAAKMGLPADMAAEQKQARVDDITKVTSRPCVRLS